MLCGSDRAPVASRAKGTTFEHNCYEARIRDLAFNIWDTTGLNETQFGTVTAAESVKNVYELISKLDRGISLLVFVIRPSTKTVQKNYELFYEDFCERSVPIVLCVTGLEQFDPMDSWWDDYKAEFKDMRFQDHLCITSSKGKRKNGRFVYQEEYDECVGKAWQLILTNCERVPWQKSHYEWTMNFMSRSGRWVKNLFGYPIGQLAEIFVKHLGMDVRDANKKATEFQMY
jgi:hypothetical protein